MKSPFLIGLSVLCVGSLILNAYQWQRYRTFQDKFLVQQPIDKEEGFSERMSERKKELLQKRLHILEKEKLRLKSEKNGAVALSASGAETEKREARGDNAFRELLRTPEMKEFMKARQRGALADSYKDFVNRIALSPQEREKFLNLLAENQMQWMDRGGFRGSQSSTNQFNVTESNLETELQKLLGPARYSEYEAYQKTIGQRMALTQFEQQIALGETPLESYQKDQLLQILTEENRNSPLSGIRQRDRMRTLNGLDQNAINQYFENQRKANERALVRAQTVLNPKQFEQFKEFQNGLLRIHETSFKAFRERSDRQN